METLEIKLLAEMKILTNSIRDLTQAVNSLKLEQYQANQPLDYKLPPHLKRQAM